MNLLTITILLPLVGTAALAVAPRGNTQLIKIIALVSSLVTLVSSLLMLTKYKFGVTGFQLVSSHTWFKVFNINYAVGIDGLALVLILLTTVLVPIVVVGGWNEAEGGRWSVKTFYMLILVLEMFMVAVFAATDVFLLRKEALWYVTIELSSKT